MKMASFANSWLLLISILLIVLSYAYADFDVRQHLCTASSYNSVKETADNEFMYSTIPDGCTPIHLNLLARHGTRSPTQRRIGEFDELASRLEVLVDEAKRKAEKGDLSFEKIPGWLVGWKSPWKMKGKGAELMSRGEDELYNLGIRMRERFKDLFNEEYHPDVFPIKASQVDRVTTSAVAFGMGLFRERGNLGPAKNRAFSVTSESLTNDTLLRFHYYCTNYEGSKNDTKIEVEKLKKPYLDDISFSLMSRFELKFAREDVATLWFLCKQEASLMDKTDQACALFTPSEVILLEWMDDVEVFMLKGYYKSVNYLIGIRLLEDVIQSMEQAIEAREGNYEPGTYEKARLRFAHAETLVPFSCLLGLFLEEADLELLKPEQPLELPPKPPQKRNWRGKMIAPFAGNSMLVLYNCPANHASKYYVQVQHNEVPVPLLGCGGSDFCSFKDFKKKIVNPHLVHDYDSICGAKLEEPKKISDTRKLDLGLVHDSRSACSVKLEEPEQVSETRKLDYCPVHDTNYACGVKPEEPEQISYTRTVGGQS